MIRYSHERENILVSADAYEDLSEILEKMSNNAMCEIRQNISHEDYVNGEWADHIEAIREDSSGDFEVNVYIRHKDLPDDIEAEADLREQVADITDKKLREELESDD